MKQQKITIEEFHKYAELYEAGVISEEEYQKWKGLVLTPDDMRRAKKKNMCIFYGLFAFIVILIIIINVITTTRAKNREAARDWDGFQSAMDYYVSTLPKGFKTIEWTQGMPFSIKVIVSTQGWNATDKLTKVETYNTVSKYLRAYAIKYKIIDTYDYAAIRFYSESGVEIVDSDGNVLY